MNRDPYNPGSGQLVDGRQTVRYRVSHYGVTGSMR